MKGRTARRACRAVVIQGRQGAAALSARTGRLQSPRRRDRSGRNQNGLRPARTEGRDRVFRKVLQETVTVTEHYRDGSWASTFFLIELLDQVASAQSLTKEEQAVGVQLRWVNTLDALDLLETYNSRHPHGSNIHNREFLGLIHSLQNTPA
ncbi:MAG: hypothetical protein MZU79_05870 [Anaerotruncus sp.]|nr:hypothetical protein [Anaerotruncus sp.]